MDAAKMVEIFNDELNTHVALSLFGNRLSFRVTLGLFKTFWSFFLEFFKASGVFLGSFQIFQIL